MVLIFTRTVYNRKENCIDMQKSLLQEALLWKFAEIFIRINFRQFEQTHAMENVIYNELRMRGYNDEYGILTLNIYDFLLNPRSLEQ